MQRDACLAATLTAGGADGGQRREVLTVQSKDVEHAGRGGPGPDGEPLLGAADLLAILHRFGNIVLWLNGHTHVNAVRSHHRPDDPARGFWEVTTCAVIDWPRQTRLVELIDRGGYLSIVCTMVDHDTPAAAAMQDPDALASLHRELAANVPFRGAGSGVAGQPADRNVELRVAPPSPLSRLSSS